MNDIVAADPTAAVGMIREKLGPSGWIDGASDMAPYLVDWSRRFGGEALGVARPASTEEVSAVVKAAAAARLPIVPQGGNTGLCGGSVPIAGAAGPVLLLSLQRMNRVRAVDPVDYTMTVEAGCILENLQKTAAEHDRYFPLSLAAEGSCTIGGNLSTNAGGTNVLQYGNARELVLGLEVVLADGEVWDGLRSLRKDNRGYDLKNLFVGAEGTLGIITAAVLRLFPMPRAIAAALVAVDSPEAALTLLERARAAGRDSVETFEFLPRETIELVLRHIPGIQDPMAQAYPYYVLLELVSTADEGGETRELLEGLLADAIEEDVALDAVIAQSEAQREGLWRIRESIPEAGRAEGPSVTHDVSVPVSKVPAFYRAAVAAIEEVAPGARASGFGHMGDGNLHFSIRPAAGDDPQSLVRREAEVNAPLFDLLERMQGSFSAEHGIGQRKVGQLAKSKSAVEMRLMRGIKGVLDPLGIMNPGKVL